MWSTPYTRIKGNECRDRRSRLTIKWNSSWFAWNWTIQSVSEEPTLLTRQVQEFALSLRDRCWRSRNHRKRKDMEWRWKDLYFLRRLPGQRRRHEASRRLRYPVGKFNRQASLHASFWSLLTYESRCCWKIADPFQQKSTWGKS